MSIETIWLRTDADRQQIRMAIAGLPLADGKGYKITVKEVDRRTLDQNAKLWAMLTDISKQVEWHGNWLTPDEWKTVLTAGLKRSKVVPGIEGGFVVIGSSTSQMTRREFGELIDLIDAFGAEHNVRWSTPRWMQEAYAA